ncbi:hypothetical protein [Rhodococcus koreensis]
MKREIHYHWRVCELMARAGMKNSRDLVGPLRDQGITLSESQIYRIVGQEPDQVAFKVLVALAAINIGGSSDRSRLVACRCLILSCFV